MNLLLKRATLKDFEEVKKIEKSAASQTYAAYIEEKDLRKFIKNEFVFLIKNGKNTVGGIAYHLRKNGCARMTNLALLPEYRGKGFGTQAIVLLFKKVNKFKKIDLTVHPHNSRAIALYLSLGFVITSWENNYCGDGEPRLILERKIK